MLDNHNALRTIKIYVQLGVFINMVYYYRYPSRHLVKQRVKLSIVMMH